MHPSPHKSPLFQRLCGQQTHDSLSGIDVKCLGESSPSGHFCVCGLDFIKSYRVSSRAKQPYIDACRTAIETITDTTGLDTEIEKLLQEKDIVAGLIKKCISDNASTAQDQTEYNNRYNAYADRYEQAKAKYDELTSTRNDRIAKRNTINRFLKELEQRDELLTEFDNCLWLTVVDRVTVHQDGSLTFRFYNEAEISG